MSMSANDPAPSVFDDGVPNGVTLDAYGAATDGRHPLVAELDRVAAELTAARRTIADLEAQVVHLETALTSSREIGAAIGVLMNQRHIDADAAFGLLRTVSQNSHRKLRDVASDVLYTGTLE